MVYIIYGKHENNDLVSAVNDKEHVVICDSFSIFSEEIKTIKKILNETDEKDCILVHDEKCSVPVGEALYLLERCGADRVFDWCCSPNWQLYIEEASNAPLLNIVDGYYLTELNGTHLETANNPFTSVLFGKETDGIWNERPYSIHVTRECISIRRIIRNALVKNISESFGRNCTKKDYDDFKKEHGLWLDGIGECIQKDVLIKSFYDDDLQWENVFSKRSTLNTGKILRQRLNEFEGDIEQNVRTVKGYFRDILRDAVVRCTERPGYGIRFAHEFLTMFLIPEITSFMEASSEQYNQLKDAEMKFKQEVDESAYAALHVVEELVKQTHYDYILTKNAPSYLLGYYLKKKYGLKWVASWNDPYPHDKYPYPYGKGWNYSTMNIQREISRMRKADIHIFPNDRIKSWMQHYLAVPETNIRIVPHVLIPQTAKRPQIQNELRLIHSGSLTAPRNPENLFRALARILSEDPSIKIKLSILGKMDENSLNLINELHLQESIKFLGNVAYDDSIALLSNYDVAVIVEADCKEGIFLPTKVADFMSVNIPILSLSPRTGVLNDLFVAGNIPYFASVDSIDDIAECIHALYQDFKRNDIRQNKIPHEYTSQYVVETYQKL